MTTATKSLVQTLAALAVLGGLAAYAWFGVEKTEQAKQEKEEADKKPFKDLDLDSLRKIELDAKGGNYVVERNEKDTPWRVTKPVATEADNERINSLLKTIKDYEVKRTVTDANLKVSEFGLEPAKLRVAVYNAAHEKFEINVGEKFEFDNNYFARTGAAAGSVDVVASTVYNGINKDFFDLRLKQLVEFKNDDAQTVELVNGGDALKLERRDGKWRLLAPVDMPADKDTVDKILNNVKSRVSKFVYDLTPADKTVPAERWGLNKPGITVTVDLGAKGRHTVALADLDEVEADDKTPAAKTADEANKKERVYAMRVGALSVAAFDKKKYDELKLTVEDLRDKTVADFDRKSAARVEVSQGGELKLALVKDPKIEKETDAWSVETPALGKAKSYKVSSLLYTLATLKSKAARLDPDKKMLMLDDPASATAVVKDQDGKLLAQINFGAKVEDGENVWVLNPQKAWADQIEQRKIDDIFKPADDFADKPKEEAKTDAASSNESSDEN